jgi:hypothetical protein
MYYAARQTDKRTDMMKFIVAFATALQTYLKIMTPLTIVTRHDHSMAVNINTENRNNNEKRKMYRHVSEGS